VVESPDVKRSTISTELHEQGLDKEVCTRLLFLTPKSRICVPGGDGRKILKPPQQVRIAVRGKYTELADS